MFLMDAIVPIANRVLRKLGIKEIPSQTLCTLDLVDGNAEIDKQISLKVGDSYAVTLNGEKYTLMAAYFEQSEMTYLGNLAATGIPGATDTGEPFFVAEIYDVGKWSVFAVAPGINGKLTIGTAETITPIDKKYLPGPVVIDLDKYGSPTTVTGILWELLGAGGGKRANVDIGSLFDDLKTDNPVRVRFSYPSGGEFMTIAVDGVTIVRTAKRVEQLCFSCVIAQGSVISSVAVTITPSGYITMSVTVA